MSPAAPKGRKPREATPPAQLQELERALAGTSELARGYLVRGDEPWFRDSAVALLVEAALHRGLEVVRHDAADPDLDPAALLGDLAAAPMFAEARLVLVRSVQQLLRREEGGDEAPIVAAAAAFLRDRAVPGTLVLEGDPVRADGVLAKAVAAAGGTTLSLRRLWETPPPWNPDPSETELVQWLRVRARLRKVRLDPREALYVVAATGNDLPALDAALDALARGGAAGVRALVPWTGTVAPFELAEHLLRGEAGAAVAGIEGLLRSGMRTKEGAREVKAEATMAMLLGSLRGKLREALLLARAAEKPGRPGRERMRGPPRALADAEQRATLRRAAEWESMLEDLAALERKTRSGRTVDASDLAALALRWKKTPVRARR